MNNLRKRITTLLGTVLISASLFPVSVFAEEYIEGAEATLQYTQMSTYTLNIPAILDITNGNCIGFYDANIGSDQEVYCRVSQANFNSNDAISMTHIDNSERSIDVTLYNYLNEPLSSSNTLLCVYDGSENLGDYSTWFYGIPNTSENIQAGKYRASVWLEVGVRTKQ